MRIPVRAAISGNIKVTTAAAKPYCAVSTTGLSTALWNSIPVFFEPIRLLQRLREESGLTAPNIARMRAIRLPPAATRNAKTVDHMRR